MSPQVCKARGGRSLIANQRTALDALAGRRDCRGLDQINRTVANAGAAGIVVNVEKRDLVRRHPRAVNPFVRVVFCQPHHLAFAIGVDQVNHDPICVSDRRRPNKAKRSRIDRVRDRAPDVDKGIMTLRPFIGLSRAKNIYKTPFRTLAALIAVDVAGRAALGLRIIDADCMIKGDHLFCANFLFQ
jgi:hypothetical protein